jgi:alpha-tubulin suppressor-like RCC1 family protein
MESLPSLCAKPELLVSLDQMIAVGEGARLNLMVQAKEEKGLHYRWKLNGQLLSQAKTATFNKKSTTIEDSGVYEVEVTDGSNVSVSSHGCVVVVPHKSQLIAWGDDSAGQSDVPLDLSTSALAIFAAGMAHSVAIKESDYRPVAWGDNSHGQTDVPSAQLTSPVIALAAGAYHTVAVRADLTVFAWGDNTQGQCAVPDGLADVMMVAAGEAHSLALRIDGTIVGWGSNEFGQLDVPALPAPAIAISAGQNHSIALLSDGTVVAWGANDFGQATVPPKLKNVISVGAAGDYSFAILRTGQIQFFGDNSFELTPLPVKSWRFLATAGGWDYMIGIQRNHTLSAWGSSAALMQPSAAATRVQRISAGGAHVLAIRDAQQDKLPKITQQPSLAVASVDWGQSFELTVQATGAFLRYQWYLNGMPISGATGSTYRVAAMRLADKGNYIVKISSAAGEIVSEVVTVGLKPPPLVFTQIPVQRTEIKIGQTLRLEVAASGAGNLSYIWRENGRILYDATGPVFLHTISGVEDQGYYTVSVQDEAGQIINEVAFVMVGRSGATQVVAWGDNSFGQTNVPSGLNDAIAIAAGDHHSLALRLNGSVVAWGDNQYGQATVPADLKDAVAVTACGNRSYALLADGRVWQWGQNQSGPSLGYLAYRYPTGNGIKALGIMPRAYAAGYLLDDSGLEISSYAVTDTTWYRVNGDGKFSYGNLNGWGLDSNPYGLASHLVGINAISSKVAALSDDGTAYAWVLLSQSSNDLSLPPQVYGAYKLDATALIAAAPTSWAIMRTNGAVAVLKDPKTSSGIIPPIMSNIPFGLGQVSAISGGVGHMLALRDASDDTELAITGQPQSRHVVSGAGVVLSVSVNGGGGVRYQWFKNGVKINGAEGPRLTLVTFGEADEGSYTVKVRDVRSEITSDMAVLTLGSGLAITTRPVTRVGLNEGDDLDLTVVATGDEPLSYQWLCGGHLLPDQTSATLHLDNVRYQNAGRYFVRVKDAHGAQVGAYSHVFVLPRQGTEVLAFKAGDSEFIPPADMHDAVQVTVVNGTSQVYAMALRLDGTVRVWGAQVTGKITSDAAALSDIVAITPNMILRADGVALPIPGQTIIKEFLRGRNDIEDLDELGNVALLTDGRVITSNPEQSILSVPNVDEPVGIAWVDDAFSNPSDGCGVVLSEDGNFTSSATTSKFSWPTLGAVKKLVKLSNTLFAVDDLGNWTPSRAYGASDIVALPEWIGVALLRTDTDRPPRLGKAYGVLTISTDSAARFWHRSDGGAGWKEELPTDTRWKHGALDGVVYWDDALLLRDPQEDPAIGFASHRLIVGVYETATLSPCISGAGPLTYRWEHNGRVIPDVTGSEMQLMAADPRRAGWYRLTVTSLFGVMQQDYCYVLDDIPKAKIIGWDTTGPKESPAIDNVVSIADGIALLADGTLAGWQTQSDDRDLLPSGIRDVVAVSSFSINGDRYGVALSADGILAIWSRKTGLVTATYSNVLSVRNGVAIFRSGVAMPLDGQTRYFLSAAQNQHLVDIWRFNALVVGLRDDGSVVGDWNSNVASAAFLGGTLRDVGYNYPMMLLLLEDGTEYKVGLTYEPASAMWDWAARTITQTTQIAYDPNMGTMLSITSAHQLLGRFGWDNNAPQKTDIYQLDFPWALCSAADVFP